MIDPNGVMSVGAGSGTHRWWALTGWVGLCVAIGMVTALIYQPDGWYAALDKPVFNPPAWLFAPVWTILYVAMGVAAWRVACLPGSAERTLALRQFGVQLALNAAWTPVFFGTRSLGGSVVVIVLLAIAIVVTIQRFHPLDKVAAWLLAPYLAWVAFASVLSVSLLTRNGKY